MAPRTVGEFAERVATLAGALVEATPQAVRGAGEVLERAARVNLLVATGGDSKLSRVRSGKGGAIKLTLRLEGAGRRSRAVVVPTGPIMLVEGPTTAHRLPRQTLAERTGGKRSYSMARRRKAKRAGYLWIPGVGARQFAKHPGTSGKFPVRNAFTSHSDEAAQVGLALFATSARRHITGS